MLLLAPATLELLDLGLGSRKFVSISLGLSVSSRAIRLGDEHSNESQIQKQQLSKLMLS